MLVHLPNTCSYHDQAKPTAGNSVLATCGSNPETVLPAVPDIVPEKSICVYFYLIVFCLILWSFMHSCIPWCSAIDLSKTLCEYVEFVSLCYSFSKFYRHLVPHVPSNSAFLNSFLSPQVPATLVPYRASPFSIDCGGVPIVTALPLGITAQQHLCPYCLGVTVTSGG